MATEEWRRMLRAKVSVGETLTNLSARCEGGALPSAWIGVSTDHMDKFGRVNHSRLHPIES